MSPGVERQRSREHTLAGEVAPFLDLVLVAHMDREADLDRVRPERLDRHALHALLEALEAARVGRKLVVGDVGPIEAVELLGGEALDGGDGAGGGQHGNAVLRHLLVEQGRQRDHRLVAGGADGRRAPPDVLGLRLRPGRGGRHPDQGDGGDGRQNSLEHRHSLFKIAFAHGRTDWQTLPCRLALARTP